MSVELVTGYSGVGGDGQPSRHVSSTEDGARQAGTVGTGMYVLSTGSKLSASMEDANTLVVADGDAMMNGRHVSLPDPTSFTIPTGVQGQKVSNLAVLRYEKAADSVESVTPVVLTGEPSADTPTDPAYNEGSILDGDSPVDMPLYRVVTDGINAGEPVQLFETIPSIDSLRDSISRTKKDVKSLVKAKAGFAILSAEAYMAAGMCQLHVEVRSTSSINFGHAFSPFTVSGEIVPALGGVPFGTDLFSGYIADSGGCFGTVIYSIDAGSTFTVVTGAYAV